MSTDTARKQEVLDKLTELAELDLFPALQRRSGQFFDLVVSMIAADLTELATARGSQAQFFQVSAIFAAIEQQGTALVTEVTRRLDAIRAHMVKLQQCAATPQKMATYGRAWRRQTARVEEMIATAERLADQPDWKGRASEAHLAVVPRQIEAMRDLRSLAETASESVLVVGAIQSNIFDACGLILTQAVEQLRGHVSTAPAAFFSRTAAALTLLGNVEVMLGKWLSGEGTWNPSATQIADGLSSTSTSFEWPRAVTSPADGGGKDKGKEKDKEEGKSGGWVTTVTEDGITVTRPDGDAEQATGEPADPGIGAEASDGPSDTVEEADGGEPEVTPPAPDSGAVPVGPEAEPVVPPLAEAPVEQVAPDVPVPLPQPPVEATQDPVVPETTFDQEAVEYNPEDLLDRGRTAWEGLNTVEMLR